MAKKDENNTSTTTSPISIIGLVLAVILPPIGLIISIVALIQAKKNPSEKQGLAIAGIAVAAVELVLTFLLLSILVFSAVKSDTTLVTYRSTNPTYSVQYPKGWQIEDKSDNTAKSTIFKDAVKDTGLVHGQEEVVYLPPPANGYTSDILVAVREGLKTSNKDFVIQSESRQPFKGLQSITFVATYKGETGTIKGKFTIIQKSDSSVFVLNTQAPIENWDSLQEEFYTIHNTFQP